jgi:hypothetical protein
MSATHITRSAPAYHGPRFSASDRPLPPVRGVRWRSIARWPAESRALWGARARLSAAMIALVTLVALAGLAAPWLLMLLMVVLITGAAIGGAFHLADRWLRLYPASRRQTRRDTC